MTILRNMEKKQHGIDYIGHVLNESRESEVTYM